MAVQLDWGIISERLAQEATRLARPDPLMEPPAPEVTAAAPVAGEVASRGQHASLMRLARRIARHVPGARLLRDWIVGSR